MPHTLYIYMYPFLFIRSRKTQKFHNGDSINIYTLYINVEFIE